MNTHWNMQYAGNIKKVNWYKLKIMIIYWKLAVSDIILNENIIFIMK